ncbi:ethanolamine utilization protein EutJ [Verminephrobacter aporrectodeae subsp. tuberculatae]|uniref:ABC transporter substrate-binding protein n=1 Tax=Verminephrobacter aporrectodeae TaxID=1110389 RepID=UPI0022431FAB|nr:ABC transporter substrate-binding protein [Verminephrobacter aporrectodeae]MCW8163665.1 ethanolamine utilization protein EutJ [Verminephrobacter aporrectodeae subsp. tuberculatae]MCW8168465.1 ethanolamine utilization protein EutJ [Verminephrobacter aporrectodeae subsp. tuberculatae]MCW8206917.1 ethanolamine utilization protein EutJ [Verminephrobacter aporrectodeae subsp. tuberculatae]
MACPSPPRPGHRRLGVLPLAAALLATLATLGSGAACTQERVKIGFTGPLSGGAALYGRNVVNGLEMAIREVNAAGLEVGGKKYRMELVALDDRYAPADAAINARRLVQQHQTPAVFVPHSGGVYALQAFNEQEKFIVMAYSSTPKITGTGNKLTIRIPPTFNTYIEPFTHYQMQRFGKRVGLLPGDHEYAKNWAQLFAPAWERAGGTVVSNNPMSYNRSTDFYSGVSRVLAERPDVLFVGGPSEPTALVVRQARELGFKGGFLLMDQVKIDEMAKITGGLAPLEGSIGVLPVSYDERVGPRRFVQAYHRAYGADKDPTAESSYNYTLVHALAAAMKLAGSTRDAAAIRAKIGEALAQLPETINAGNLQGVDSAGDTVTNPLAAAVEGGKIKRLSLPGLTKGSP